MLAGLLRHFWLNAWQWEEHWKPVNLHLHFLVSQADLLLQLVDTDVVRESKCLDAVP